MKSTRNFCLLLVSLALMSCGGGGSNPVTAVSSTFSDIDSSRIHGYGTSLANINTATLADCGWKTDATPGYYAYMDTVCLNGGITDYFSKLLMQDVFAPLTPKNLAGPAGETAGQEGIQMGLDAINTLMGTGENSVAASTSAITGNTYFQTKMNATRDTDTFVGAWGSDTAKTRYDSFVVYTTPRIGAVFIIRGLMDMTNKIFYMDFRRGNDGTNTINTGLRVKFENMDLATSSDGTFNYLKVGANTTFTMIWIHGGGGTLQLGTTASGKWNSKYSAIVHIDVPLLGANYICYDYTAKTTDSAAVCPEYPITLIADNTTHGGLLIGTNTSTAEALYATYLNKPISWTAVLDATEFGTP